MKSTTVLFEKIAEPQRLSIAISTIYALSILAGCLSLMSPPDHVISHVGRGAMVILSALLIIGGVIGIPAAITGHQKVEESAIFAVALAGAIYEGVVIFDYIIGPGNRPVQASFTLMVLIFFYMRWEHIRHLAYNPVLSKRGRQIDDDLITGDIFSK